MRRFENQVQLIKYEITREVAKRAMAGILKETIHTIPATIDPGPEPRFRCCIHHERAITAERVRMTMGGDRNNPNLIEVLDAACDQCLIDRFFVTEACRGCIAHRCKQSCPKDAISITGNRATIDQSKCIECGKCMKACPYNAIADVMRPCKKACPTNALEINEKRKAVIKPELCIQCGACVYQCPFGAIQEKSQILDVITLLKGQKGGQSHVYAMVAPAFATQFDYVSRGQVISGIKALGFRDVVEVALGADMVILHEAEELVHAMEAGEMLTSSCCPAFVGYIRLKYPAMMKHVSKTISPMTATARLIRSMDPDAVTVFIGPCTAKKREAMEESEHGTADHVLTFEELACLMDAAGIDLETMQESALENASAYGRKLASSGGLSEGVLKTLESMDKSDGVVAVLGDGIRSCDTYLKKAQFNRLDAHFIEGMACEGGCIKGPVTMHHGQRDFKVLDNYCQSAIESEPCGAVSIFKDNKVQMMRD